MHQLAQTSPFPYPKVCCSGVSSESSMATFPLKILSYWRHRMNFFFFPLAPSRLWDRRQETAMFILTLWSLLLDVWYLNKPLSHWTAERHFSQGVLGEPLVCPPYTNSWVWLKRMARGMVGWRYARQEKKKKKFNVSSPWGSIKNSCSPQTICSDDVHMPETGPVPPTMHVKDWIMGNTEQGSSLNKWNGESQAWSKQLVPSESHK